MLPRSFRLHSILLTSIAILDWRGMAQPPKKNKFMPPCGQPYGSLARKGLSIDRTCGELGVAADGTPQGDQNKAKNNFCASGDPVTITPETLLKLQAAVEDKGISFGGDKRLPADRTDLIDGFDIDRQQLGEGKLVRMAAFLIETHIADLSSGESVNCKVAKSKDSNDVHMALGLAYGASECTSVTAEVSPHFRPKAWASIASVKAQNKIKKPAAITRYPVRITGQLFFDGSHTPCQGDQALPGNPARQSLWEIHPVYAVDVCSNQDLDSCSAEDEGVWTPLNRWKAKGH